ncbi:hypothetical protein CRENBAI_005078 [Crenichthys baileyi]|uniref:Uncharacterized protein n=1 Tax=Crenichthys baileyi TaxID=28760 RepID=A0AAV9SP47_9TELE
MSDVLFRLLRGLGKTLITTGMKFFLSFLVKIRVVTSGKTFGAHNELLNQLEKKLVLIQGDQPRNSITMLFCPITSRVGSDVKAAMSLVSEDQNVILVLMHHTRDGSYSTAGTEWSGVYRNIILAVHVLFHESVPGLLTCPKNKMAVDKMLAVLNSYSYIGWRRSLPKICVGLGITYLLYQGLFGHNLTFFSLKHRKTLAPYPQSTKPQLPRGLTPDMN